jgi:L-malate glycosyltransferase
MKNLLYIGNKLSKHGYSGTGIEILGPLLQRRGYRVYYSSSKKNKILRMLDMIFALLRYRSVDFVLIDTYSTTNFYYAVVIGYLCRLFKIRYIPILHGGNLPARLVKSPKTASKFFGHAHVNVAPSGYLAKAFRSAGFRVAQIANPVEIGPVVPKDRSEVQPNLIWVRSLSQLSNPRMAIDVLILLRESYPAATLTMVGPDRSNMTTDLKRYALEKQVQITFAGAMSRSAWISMAENHDIFLNTSTVDNTPFSLIEALMCGLYIVSTDVGGIPELVQDGQTALLCKSGDSFAMTQQVIRVLHDRDLRKSLQASAKNKVKEFSPERVAAAWDEILTTV